MMVVGDHFHIPKLPSSFSNHEAGGWSFRVIYQNNLAFAA